MAQLTPGTTITQTVASKTETSIKMNWSSNDKIDRVDYGYVEDGQGSSVWAWTYYTVSNKTSGSYTISNLQPNTSYKVKTKVHSTLGNTVESTVLTVKTYQYPYAKKMPNFTIGKPVTISVENPCAREYEVVFIDENNTQMTIGYNDADELTIRPDASRLYQSIPNAKSGTYKIMLTYNGHSITKTGGKYSCDKTECTPVIGNVTYKDVYQYTKNITHNDQLLIQNHSVVRIDATGLEVKNQAGIFEIRIVCNEVERLMVQDGTSAYYEEYAPDSGTNVNAVITLTDTRGFSTTATIELQMLEYYDPYATIELNRQQNYYTATDLKVNAQYASLNGNNWINIAYRIKDVTAGGSWSSYTTIQNNTLVTFNASNDHEWEIQVRIYDVGDDPVYYTLKLPIGMPLIFFDRLKLSTGINCFPNDYRSLEVNGYNVLKMLMFEPGDEMSLTNGVPLTGYITSASKTVRIAVPVHKSLDAITTVTVTSMTGGIRVATGGYLNSGSDSDNWLNKEGITVSTRIANDRMVVITLTSATAFTNVNNNSPLVYACAPLTITFS